MPGARNSSCLEGITILNSYGIHFAEFASNPSTKSHTDPVFGSAQEAFVIRDYLFPCIMVTPLGHQIVPAVSSPALLLISAVSLSDRGLTGMIRPVWRSDLNEGRLRYRRPTCLPRVRCSNGGLRSPRIADLHHLESKSRRDIP